MGKPSGLGHGIDTGFRPARAIHAASGGIGLLAGLALAGCAMPVVRDNVQLGGSRIAIVQAVDAQGDGAIISLQLGEAKPMPLPFYLAARIEGVFTVGDYRLLLIAGTTKDCPRQESLLIAKGDAGQIKPLGKCPDRFVFTATYDQWSAKQINARDPLNWNFRDGKLTGPVLQSALSRPRARLAQPERAPEPERASEPEHPAEPERASDPGRTGDAAPAPSSGQPPEPTVSPIRPPPVSRPVGDDVVPPPVGAGPLPGRATPAPRVF